MIKNFIFKCVLLQMSIWSVAYSNDLMTSNNSFVTADIMDDNSTTSLQHNPFINTIIDQAIYRDQRQLPIIETYNDQQLEFILRDRGFWPEFVNYQQDSVENEKQLIFDNALASAYDYFGLPRIKTSSALLISNFNELNWQNAANQWKDNLMQNWLEAKSDNASKFITVNIPSYTLQVWQTEPLTLLMESRVIVGRQYTKTPLMKTNIVNLKLNPDWSPPPSIKNSKYTPPGPNNPLGMIRFSTDNNVNIYLHDTNQRSLFNNHERALSHGCVRVESWKNLAMVLSGFTEEDLDMQLNSKKTKFFTVETTPVFIQYQLYDVVNGKLGLHNDIYKKF